MTVRWVISHAANLPHESRIVKYYNNTPFDTKEHMVLDVMDILRTIAYYTSVGATAEFKESDRRNIHKGAPKSFERPVLREEQKPKKKFLNANEVKEIMGGRFI